MVVVVVMIRRGAAVFWVCRVMFVSVCVENLSMRCEVDHNEGVCHTLLDEPYLYFFELATSGMHPAV